MNTLKKFNMMNHLGKSNQTIVRGLDTGNAEYTDHINQAQGRDTGELECSHALDGNAKVTHSGVYESIYSYEELYLLSYLTFLLSTFNI